MVNGTKKKRGRPRKNKPKKKRETKTHRHGRRTVRKKTQYDEKLFERAVTEFNLQAQNFDETDPNFKKNMSTLLKNVAQSFSKYEWENFRKALYRRIPYFRDKSKSAKGVTGKKQGISPKLTNEEEEDIVAWIKQRARMKLPPDHLEIQDEVAAVTNGRVKGSNNWFYKGFLIRHGDKVKGCIAESSSNRRAQAKKTKNFKQHFRSLNEVVELAKQKSGKTELSPNQFANLDEKPFGTRKKKGPKVYTGRDQDAHIVFPQDKCWTACETIYANGHIGKRIYIFQGVNLPKDFDITEIDPNGVAVCNPKGGMTRKIWDEVVVPNIISSKPSDLGPDDWVVLKVDGFDSHLYGVKSLKAFSVNEFLLWKESSNNSDALQELDVGIFGPLEKAHSKELTHFRKKYGDSTMSQYEHAIIYHHCIVKVETPKNIENTFIKTGVYPTLDYDKFISGPGKNIQLTDRKKIEPNFTPFSPPRTNFTAPYISPAQNVTPPRYSKKQVRAASGSKFDFHIPPLAKKQTEAIKTDLSGIPIGKAYLLNEPKRIRKLARLEMQKAAWEDKMNTMRERRLHKGVQKKIKEKQMIEYKKKVKPISKFLINKTHIKPGSYAKLSNIRSYLNKNKLATKKQRNEINEENVSQLFFQYVTDDVVDDSETETETDP